MITRESETEQAYANNKSKQPKKFDLNDHIIVVFNLYGYLALVSLLLLWKEARVQIVVGSAKECFRLCTIEIYLEET